MMRRHVAARLNDLCVQYAIGEVAVVWRIGSEYYVTRSGEVRPGADLVSEYTRDYYRGWVRTWGRKIT